VLFCRGRRYDSSVTLILGMSKREGVYLSVDYRVTNLRTGRVVDDATVKFLTVDYPGKPKALIAYTGVAYARDGAPIGDWIRETLRGENEVIDASMRHLRDRLDRDIAPMREPLIVNVLVVEGERRLFGGLSNLRQRTGVMRSFEYVMQELTEPMAFANGSGAHTVLGGGHVALLKQQVEVRPRRIEDHLNLLATINRRVAEVNKTVSSHCHVAFVNADDRYQPVSRPFDEGHPMPLRMPMIKQGIDLSYMFDHFQRFRAGELIDDLDADEVNRHLQRRP
jgi:hypothetical protein